MNRIRLSGVYEWGILTVLFLIVLHAPLSVWFGMLLPDFAMVIKAWKEIVLALLSAAAIVLITRHKLWKQFLESWIVRLCFLFIAVHLVLAVVIGGQIESIVAGLMIDLRFIVMFLLTYTLLLLRPTARKHIVQTLGVGSAVVLGFGLLQITVLPDGLLREIGYSRDTITPYTTIDSNPDYVRINSTLRGPNPLGAVAVLYAALAVAYLLYNLRSGRNKQQYVAGAAFFTSVAVLFASYSRSAYLALIAAIGSLVLLYGRLSKRLIIAGLAGAVIVSGGLVLVSSTDWYANVVLHEDPESTVVTKSNQGHIESFKMGVERAVKQPFGAGIGSTGSASLYDDSEANDAVIENYYLFVAHESGWIGLIIFGWLFVSVLISLWKRRSDWLAAATFASGIGIAVIGLLLPVWADETVALIWWGIAGAVIAQGGIIGGGNGRRTSK